MSPKAKQKGDPAPPQQQAKEETQEEFLAASKGMEGLSQSEKLRLILANQEKIEKKAKENRQKAGIVDSEEEEELA